MEVKVDNKVKQSVITMIMHISQTVDDPTIVQAKSMFSPPAWLDKNSSLQIGLLCLKNPLCVLGIYPYSKY